MGGLHGGNSCLTPGELATCDSPTAVTQNMGLAMSREERDGARETKPPTQSPSGPNWAVTVPPGLVIPIQAWE